MLTSTWRCKIWLDFTGVSLLYGRGFSLCCHIDPPNYGRFVACAVKRGFEPRDASALPGFTGSEGCYFFSNMGFGFEPVAFEPSWGSTSSSCDPRRPRNLGFKNHQRSFMGVWLPNMPSKNHFQTAVADLPSFWLLMNPCRSLKGKLRNFKPRHMILRLFCDVVIFLSGALLFLFRIYGHLARFCWLLKPSIGQ